MADILTTLSARIDELAEQTKKLADSVSSAGSQMGNSMSAFDRALRQAEEETAKVGVKLKGLDSAFSSVGHGAKSFKELSDATGYSQNQLKAFQRVLNAAGDDLDGLARSSGLSADKLRELRTALNDVARSQAQVNQQVQRTSQAQSHNASGSTMQSLMGGISSISAYAIAAAGVIGGLAGAFRAGIGEQTEVDRLADSIKGLTGSYESALPVVQEFKDLHDETGATEQQMASAVRALVTSGFDYTRDSLKSLIGVANASGMSIDQLADKMRGFANGRLTSFRELGITAKQVGNEIEMTYDGQTTKIANTQAALEAYLVALGNTKFADFQNQTQNISTALDQLGGTFAELSASFLSTDGAFGSAVVDAINALNSALDKNNGIFITLRETVNTFTVMFREWTAEVAAAADDSFGDVSDDAATTLNAFDELAGGTVAGFTLINEVLTNFGSSVVGVFDMVGKSIGGLLAIVRSVVSDAVTLLGYLGDRIGSTAHKLVEMGSAIKSMDFDRLRDTVQSFGNAPKMEALQTGTVIKAAFEDIKRSASATGTSLVAATAGAWEKGQQAAMRYFAKVDEAKKKAQSAEAEAVRISGKASRSSMLAPAAASSSSKSSGTSAADTELKKYEAMLKAETTAKQKQLSDVEQIAARYQAKQDELDALKTVSAEKRNALEVLFEENKNAEIEALRTKAHENLINAYGTEQEQAQLAYSKSLEELQKEYDEKLILEDEFQKAKQALKDQYLFDEKGQVKSKAAKGGDAKNKFSALGQMLGIDQKELQGYETALNGIATAFGSIGDAITATGGDARAAFAIQKSFAVASAMLNCYAAWAKALGTSATWYDALANYAAAVAMTGGIISQVMSVSMHDTGGVIKPGELGIVGEKGAELISGGTTGVSVQSRVQTADMMRNAARPQTTVNLIENSERAGETEETETKDEHIINLFVSQIRNGGRMSSALERYYGTKRVGA